MDKLQKTCKNLLYVVFGWKDCSILLQDIYIHVQFLFSKRGACFYWVPCFYWDWYTVVAFHTCSHRIDCQLLHALLYTVILIVQRHIRLYLYERISSWAIIQYCWRYTGTVRYFRGDIPVAKIRFRGTPSYVLCKSYTLSALHWKCKLVVLSMQKWGVLCAICRKLGDMWYAKWPSAAMWYAKWPSAAMWYVK